MGQTGLSRALSCDYKQTHHFENAVTIHLRVKNIPKERWVSTVAFNMEDPLAIDWLAVIGSKLLLIEEGLGIYEFRLKNILLINTSFQLDETHICHQPKSHMEKELATDCAMEKLYLINDFNNWLGAVTDLDKKRQCQLAIIAKELAQHNNRYPPHIAPMVSL
ncbi:hypothetical protein BDN71DRAFT_1434027 [Pleurotus eryngii]|uniref:Uncharacterized protein n=1 Tax=Pleurotus eryngii TaxID=5323 RepID=A0A9P5ZN62_PLEER|nr:hypothetical protein BDN71DRAFT_1434027 [Pleurotus eryngii]